MSLSDTFVCFGELCTVLSESALSDSLIESRQPLSTLVNARNEVHSAFHRVEYTLGLSLCVRGNKHLLHAVISMSTGACKCGTKLDCDGLTRMDEIAKSAIKEWSIEAAQRKISQTEKGLENMSASCACMLADKYSRTKYCDLCWAKHSEYLHHYHCCHL